MSQFTVRDFTRTYAPNGVVILIDEPELAFAEQWARLVLQSFQEGLLNAGWAQPGTWIEKPLVVME